MKATLEICVDSLESALAAEAGGADRIELCAALSEGGLTPSLGFTRAARSRCSIPLYIMIRPRLGDFHYSEEELAIMRDDIRAACDVGANGVVFGALTESATIHESHTARLLEAANTLDVTFHRAFDVTRDLDEALQTLIRLGVPRVLTSGGEPSALEGKSRLQQLVALADNRIAIMAGGGVRTHNLAELATHRIREFHSGVTRSVPSPIRERNHKIHFGTQDSVRQIVHADDVRALRNTLLTLL